MIHKIFCSANVCQHSWSCSFVGLRFGENRSWIKVFTWVPSGFIPSPYLPLRVKTNLCLKSYEIILIPFADTYSFSVVELIATVFVQFVHVILQIFLNAWMSLTCWLFAPGKCGLRCCWRPAACALLETLVLMGRIDSKVTRALSPSELSELKNWYVLKV